MPKLSVITPIYNTEKTLDKCLSSLVKQTISDIEFIWIDNAASDECRAIINKYKEKRENIKIISLAENVGYSGAMNAGLENATGDFIGFCDSDDWVDADYYEKLYNSAISKDVDVVLCDTIFEYPDFSKLKSLKKNIPLNQDGALFLADTNGSVWNGIYSNAFLKKHNIKFSYNTKKSIYRDCVFAIQVMALSKKNFIDSSAQYHYVQYPNSTIHGISKQDMYQARYEVMEETFHLLDLKRVSDVSLQNMAEFLLGNFCLHNIPKFPEQFNEIIQRTNFSSRYRQWLLWKKPSFVERLFSIVRHPITKSIKLRFLGVSLSINTKRRN